MWKKQNGFLIITLFAVFSFNNVYSTETDGEGFGINLPQGITPNEIVSLIAPNENRSLVTLIGMKKWPYKENTFIGIVCLAPDRNSLRDDSVYADGKPCCFAGYGGFNEAGNPCQVCIGVIEYEKKLKLIATYGKPFDVKVSWQNSNIENGSIEKDDSVYPGIYEKFDFANYKIADDKVAFGIRAGWRVMYSGGGGMYEALLLFTIQGNNIVNILSEPIEESGMSGGQWNDDGTRDHIEWDMENIVVILPGKKSGYYDLRIKEKNGKWKKTFRWNPEAQRYLSLD